MIVRPDLFNDPMWVKHNSLAQYRGEIGGVRKTKHKLTLDSVCVEFPKGFIAANKKYLKKVKQ